ncbi:FAD-binding domain [Dillenia turbinata]|uniref:FAD-binding domain n=1 Tax=Dillenia turbinata TaxID=194707 RepID=A0AAN8VU98_9MAGN
MDSYGEARCLKRSTLIEALASDLPPNTVRLSCQVNAIKLDPLTSDPVVYLEDGTLIKAKVVIGCDGLNSVVASFLELKFNYNYSTSLVRGLTYYEKGHGMDDFVILYKDPTRLGRIPIDENLVYWFVVQNRNPQDPLYMKDQKLMQQSALESIKDFPREAVEIIEKADLDSFHYACLGYRVPWDLLFKRHYKGGVTVAGDAMHAMAPFMGQGGAASIEDAVVLARCAAPTIQMLRANQKEGKKMLELAFHQYEKERKMRVTLLCLQTYLIGLLIKTSSSLGKFVTILLMIILFRDPDKLSLYDCGRL